MSDLVPETAITAEVLRHAREAVAAEAMYRLDAVPAHKIVEIAIRDAAPLIDAAARASERERIRQLAIDRDATWQPTAICRDCTREPHPYPAGPRVPFADLIASERPVTPPEGTTP